MSQSQCYTTRQKLDALQQAMDDAGLEMGDFAYLSTNEKAAIAKVKKTILRASFRPVRVYALKGGAA